MVHYAITRKPGENFSSGETSSLLGKADWQQAIEQHTAYCEALANCDVEVMLLESSPEYPDGTFVEDTAVILDEVAVITCPGAMSRRGEQLEIAETLRKSHNIIYLQKPAMLDGGDILRIENHFLLGVSQRTNDEGVRQLGAILQTHGYTSEKISVAQGLHLKTHLTYLGNHTIITTHDYENSPQLQQYHKIIVDDKEAYAANCLLVNDCIFVAESFPKTRWLLDKLGRKVVELNMSEFRKMDGGLTCLSLLW